MKKNENIISTRLSLFDGAVMRITNRGHGKNKKGFYCFLEVNGKDVDFVTDAAYDFRTWLENADLYGEFLGVRQMVQEDIYSGFSPSTKYEYEYSAAMLMIYVDKQEFPLVKRLYKQRDLKLKKAFETDKNCSNNHISERPII